LKPVSLFAFSGALILESIDFHWTLLFSTIAISEKNEATWLLSAYSYHLGLLHLERSPLWDSVGHRIFFISGLVIFAVCSIINVTVQNL